MLGPLALRGGAFRRHDADVDDSIIVEQFKALGDRVRWAIVSELRSGTRCACELSDVAEVSPTLLSHHLKVLCKAGLIAGTKRGRWVDYTLDTNALAALFALAEPETVAS
jgi:ArsR family transcriptional regulator